MPTLKRFKIRNFRGIQNAEINIDVRKKSDVVTLIGLNESGKTTILEALSHFSTGDRTIANLLGAAENKGHLLSLIPIEKRAAFTGEVAIAADIGFEPGELQKYISKAEKKFGIQIRQPTETKIINVSKTYYFKDSSFQRSVNYWNGIDFETRKSNKGKFTKYIRPKTAEDNVWLYIVDSIEEDLFELVYFPSFIVDMPARIYLEEHPDETAINLYYRNVLKDVVKSIGGGLDLEKHVNERIKGSKAKINTPSWFSDFWGGPDRKIVDAVFQRIQQVINREVIGSWEKVFKHPVNSRSVKVEWNIDTNKGDIPYLSFGISDGYSVFSIHERSLGFRWFFSYLLFTQFRSQSGKKTIFLFDEPAANLHAKAQMQLMDSIARIVRGGNKVIYSTHSPHMINPSWLSDAIIIENVAVNLQNGDDVFGLDTRSTDIKAVSYGTFVSLYPEKTTYFQPVWEKLLYEAPPIVGNGPFLCVEGISDFHFLSYVKQRAENGYDFSIVPGVGAGGFSATLPSLYGMGAKFVLLLDDDAQGQLEKKRYIEDGLIAERSVFTLGDISDQFRGKKLEDLMSMGTIDLVRGRFDGKSGKKQLGMYLAEAAASNADEQLDGETVMNGRLILDWFEQLDL